MKLGCGRQKLLILYTSSPQKVKYKFEYGRVWFFMISMVCIIKKPKLPSIYPIFGNIMQKWASFCQKWVP